MVWKFKIVELNSLAIQCTIYWWDFVYLKPKVPQRKNFRIKKEGLGQGLLGTIAFQT